jgi:predicted amidophosphoribosyltransferase
MDSIRDERSEIELECPCCGARLKIDVSLGKVIWHGKPPRKADVPDIDQSARLLEQEKARREAIFRQSTEDEKSKAQLLEKKFQEALKRSKDEPIERPSRDFDLD